MLHSFFCFTTTYKVTFLAQLLSDITRMQQPLCNIFGHGVLLTPCLWKAKNIVEIVNNGTLHTFSPKCTIVSLSSVWQWWQRRPVSCFLTPVRSVTSNSRIYSLCLLSSQFGHIWNTMSTSLCSSVKSKLLCLLNYAYDQIVQHGKSVEEFYNHGPDNVERPWKFFGTQIFGIYMYFVCFISNRAILIYE